MESLRLQVELKESLLAAQGDVLHSRRVEWLNLELIAARKSLAKLDNSRDVRQLDATQRIAAKARELVKAELLRLWPRTGAHVKSDAAHNDIFL